MQRYWLKMISSKQVWVHVVDGLQNFCIHDFKRKNGGKDLASCTRALHRLRKQCERAVRQIHYEGMTLVTIEIDSLFDGIDYVCFLDEKAVTRRCSEGKRDEKAVTRRCSEGKRRRKRHRSRQRSPNGQQAHRECKKRKMTTEVEQWLRNLDNGRGKLLCYLPHLQREFDNLHQIAASWKPCGPGCSLQNAVDPGIFDALRVEKLGHRLLIAQGIKALSQLLQPVPDSCD